MNVSSHSAHNKNFYKMKKRIINIKLVVLSCLILLSCNDEILDKKPLDKYTEAVVWSDISLARLYLNPLYANFRYGWNNRGTGYMTGIYAQEVVKTKGGLTIPYNTGQMSPDRLGDDRGHLTWNYFPYIQQLNVFLENIDRLPAAYPEIQKEQIMAEKDIIKGEALFLRALFYSEICRSYGGVPLMNKPNKFGDNFSDLTRNTFEETINFIVKDLDEAAGLLKLKSEMEMGRATKEAALALKSRMLLFAASDLTASGTVADELVGYKNPNRQALWKAAKDAAKAVIDLGTCELSDFGAPDQDQVAKKYFEFFKAKDLSDKEIIFGRMNRADVGTRIYTNMWHGPNGLYCWGNNGPLGNMVDSYQMADGSNFFDHFTINENDHYINTSSKYSHKNPYRFREPRFYASILFDSALWQPRFADLSPIDPLGIYDRRTRIVINNGKVVSERPGLDSRQGPVTPSNGGYSGYLIKKYMDENVIGRDEPNEHIHIYIRYAEILLNYAEACIGLGENETAALYINRVRNRAGLPDFTGNITAALRQERHTEFFLENIRWYDIRRWKILDEVLGPIPYGVDIKEVTEDGITTTTWRKIQVQPKHEIKDKMFWLPISQTERNRAPQLQQNPHY